MQNYRAAESQNLKALLSTLFIAPFVTHISEVALLLGMSNDFIRILLSPSLSPSMMSSSSSYLQAFHAGTAPSMGVPPLELTVGLGQLLWQQQQNQHTDQVRKNLIFT